MLTLSRTMARAASAQRPLAARITKRPRLSPTYSTNPELENLLMGDTPTYPSTLSQPSASPSPLDPGPPRSTWVAAYGDLNSQTTLTPTRGLQHIIGKPAQYRLYFQTHTRNTVATLMYVGPYDPKKERERRQSEQRARDDGAVPRFRKRDENVPQDTHWGVAHVTGGSLGFKTSKRKTFEAGYQCAVKMVRVLEEQMTDGRIEVEVLLSGFGAGREGAMAALLSTEGDTIRPLIVRLTDYTPLKVGGNRAKKTRRT